MKQGFIVAMDGPVASGKGTMAKEVAKRFGGVCLDTGSMYRALGLYFLRLDVDLNNVIEVTEGLKHTKITLDGRDVYLNGESVSDKIRTQDVSDAASLVGTYASVQEELISTRRKIAADLVSKGKIVISEGRNEGTVAFPDAEVKIYLTADLQTRVQRRFRQEKAKNPELSLDVVIKDTQTRDERDMNRPVAPLVSNPEEHGYVVIDTSAMNEEETLNAIAGVIQERMSAS